MIVTEQELSELKYAYGITGLDVQFLDHHRQIGLAVTLPDGTRRAFRADLNWDAFLDSLWRKRRVLLEVRGCE